MMFKQGEVLIVPFPFSDLSSIKQRPVVILSKTADNDKNENIITCGVTSNLRGSDYSIVIDNNDFDEGEIPVKSRIRVDKLFTLDKNIVRKKVGRLKKEVFEKVKNEFFNLV